MQLTNDEWKAGLWSDLSFASQYGEDGDLYLADEYVIDENGVIQREGENADGDYREAGVGLLIRWSEVRYLEFVEWLASDAENEGSTQDD